MKNNKTIKEVNTFQQLGTLFGRELIETTKEIKSKSKPVNLKARNKK